MALLKMKQTAAACFALLLLTHCRSAIVKKEEVVSVQSNQITRQYPQNSWDSEPDARFLREGLDQLSGESLCLITNQAGLGAYYFIPEKESSFLEQRFAERKKKLLRILTPEHGLSGQEDGHGNSEKYRFETVSLYFLTAEQIRPHLKGCDAIIFSLPDAGVRPFTYRTIFTRTLQAAQKESAADHPLEYWLIDRRNPAGELGSLGPVARKFSYLGEEKISFFPGYTLGELGLRYHAQAGMTVPLRVFRLPEYDRNVSFSRSGVRFVQPSPNLPTYHALQCYWLTVFLEGTYLDLGRNSNDPFCLIGQPDLAVEGPVKLDESITLFPYRYRPWGGTYQKKILQAYRLQIGPMEDPMKSAFLLLAFFREKHRHSGGKSPFFRSGQGIYWLDSLTGSDSLRKAIDQNHSFSEWDGMEKEAREQFQSEMKEYLLYP